MYPVMPLDFFAGGFEILCYGFTIAAALLSWFLSLR